MSFRWLFDITEKDQVRFNFLYFNNSLSITENAFGGGLLSSRPSSLDQSNLAGGLYYDKKWNDKFRTSLQFYGTNYNLNAQNFDFVTEENVNQKNEISEAGLNLNSNYKINDKLTLSNGYHFVETSIANIEKINNDPPAEDKNRKDVIHSHAISSEIAYSSEDQNTHIKFGTRLNYVGTFNRFIIEPRFSLNHRLTNKFTLEVLGEFKNQTTTLLTEETDFHTSPALLQPDLLSLFAWSEKTFLSLTEGSAIRRIGHKQWLRNIAVALGNAPANLTIIEALQQKALEADIGKLVLEHIEWAIVQQQAKLALQTAESNAPVNRKTQRVIRSIQKGLPRDA